MSTAIALQGMNTHAHSQETGALRHRPVSKGDTKNPVSTKEEDEWQASPHDTATSSLPLDTQSFVPTNVYWISPHGMLSKEIEILDLTKDLDIPFTGFSNAYKDEVRTTLKDHLFTPAFTVHRDNWIGLNHTIKDSEGGLAANWKHPWTSVGEATLTFPEDSEHSSHTISMRNKRWGFRTEAFTVDSVPFFWEMDSLWHSTNMTLYKVFGSGENQRRTEIGKYAQKWWGGFITGGTFVADENEIDGFVACLTLVVVLKKKRQRAAERSGGGGSGGGS